MAVFIMEISFRSYDDKTNFYMKNFALSLAFIMRFTATRKYPIVTFFFSASAKEYFAQYPPCMMEGSHVKQRGPRRPRKGLILCCNTGLKQK